MTTSLTFSDLQSACARLALDPRVEPSTPIELETEQEDRLTHERYTECSSAITLAIENDSGRRSIVLSTLVRPDALVR